jgi:hypothetical protein
MNEMDEDQLEDESTEVMAFKYSLTSYGADYPVDGLVKPIASGDIYVPKFQRGFVWNYYPGEPLHRITSLWSSSSGIFLSKEPESNKLLVLDGQQRLRTLQYFYNRVFDDERVFKLKGVQARFEGATYGTLREEGHIW